MKNFLVPRPARTKPAVFERQTDRAQDTPAMDSLALRAPSRSALSRAKLVGNRQRGLTIKEYLASLKLYLEKFAAVDFKAAARLNYGGVGGAALSNRARIKIIGAQTRATP
jgi:hypothetical protein